jgi:hypothetical protein
LVKFCRNFNGALSKRYLDVDKILKKAMMGTDIHEERLVMMGTDIHEERLVMMGTDVHEER